MLSSTTDLLRFSSGQHFSGYLCWFLSSFTILHVRSTDPSSIFTLRRYTDHLHYFIVTASSSFHLYTRIPLSISSSASIARRGPHANAGESPGKKICRACGSPDKLFRAWHSSTVPFSSTRHSVYISSEFFRHFHI